MFWESGIRHAFKNLWILWWLGQQGKSNWKSLVQTPWLLLVLALLIKNPLWVYTGNRHNLWARKSCGRRVQNKKPFANLCQNLIQILVFKIIKNSGQSLSFSKIFLCKSWSNFVDNTLIWFLHLFFKINLICIFAIYLKQWYCSKTS